MGVVLDLRVRLSSHLQVHCWRAELSGAGNGFRDRNTAWKV